jgi:hypothetical protein
LDRLQLQNKAAELFQPIFFIYRLDDAIISHQLCTTFKAIGKMKY